MSFFDRINNNLDCDFKECPEERENILKALTKELTLDDIGYMYCERMKLDNVHHAICREYDNNINENNNEKLIYFRMKAEYGYYLDDNDEFYLNESEEDYE